MKTENFTEGPILSKLIKFMIPIIAALLLQALYNAVDIFIIGNFAPGSMAGVSNGAQIVAFMTFMVSGMTTAVTVILGKLVGENKRDQAGDAVGNAIIFFLFIAAIITSYLVIFPEIHFRVVHLSTDAVSEGVAYMRICGAGYIFVISYNLLSSIFRGIGDSKTPLLTVGIACFINICGDLLLVGVFKMAAAGAAISTIFAQAMSVLLSLVITKRRGMPFEFSKKNLRPQWKLIKHIAALGLPLAANEFVLGFSFILLSSIINKLGMVASAALGVTIRVADFVIVITGATSQALAAFVAQNLGARQYKRARRALFYGLLVAFAVTIVVFCVGFFRGEILTGIFTQDQAVVAASASYLKTYMIDSLFACVVFSMCGYLNGCGKTKITLIQCMVGVAAKIPAALILGSLPNTTMFIIGLATPTATIVELLFLIVYLIIRRNHIRSLFDAPVTEGIS